MTEYWKSIPRKFCIYCKCWITDNKPSIDFHERGKNHQENVTKKIDELRKKGVKDAKAKESVDSDLKFMEEAALKSAQDDIKRNPHLASVYGAALTAKPAESSAVELKTSEQSKGAPVVSKKSERAAKVKSGKGTVKIAKASESKHQQVQPESFKQAETSFDVIQDQEEWQKAVSHEGYDYYWNVSTGETSWTKPGGDGPTEQEIAESTTENDADEKQAIVVLPESDPEVNVSQAVEEDVNMSKAIETSCVAPESEICVSQAVEDVSTSTATETSLAASEDKSKKELAIAVSKMASTAGIKRAQHSAYGKWVSVKVEEEPLPDLQLPTDASKYSLAAAEIPLPAANVVLPATRSEPKLFKEKVVTLQGKCVGEVAFKKRKVSNAKQNARRRDEGGQD